MFQTLKLIPAKILIFDGEVVGILVFALGGLFWLLVPFLDRPSQDGKRSFIFTAIGQVIVLFIIAMTVYGYLD